MKKIGEPEILNSQTEMEQKTWATPISFLERKKRHRRTAGEIERHYVCQIKGCTKSYGSEGSLSQHMKLKHKEYTQSIKEKSVVNEQIVSPPQISNVVESLPIKGIPEDAKEQVQPESVLPINAELPDNPPSSSPIENIKEAIP